MTSAPRTPVAATPETARLVVLSGPSGVGKGTVVSAVRTMDPDVWVSVSATTRPRREGEVSGSTYVFVTDDEFDRMVAADDLLEWAEYAGRRYGTPRRPVVSRLTAGVPVLLEIDVAGARQVRRHDPGALLVFLAPPSWQELESRLAGRGTEDPMEREKRLAIAAEEMAATPVFDVVVVNDDVERAASELLALIRHGR